MTQDDFQQAASRLRPKLAVQARRYLSDADEAEDAVQDTLLRLWQRHENLQAPIDGLAAVLLRNLCIDRLRRSQGPVNCDNVAVYEPTDEDHEQIERLMAVMDTLPDQQRTLLRLRHMEGMEMRELAEQMHMSESAVRKALSRARQAVRRRWLLVASVALVLGFGAVVLFYRSMQDECVAYIYGRKTTDRQEVMAEVQQAVQGMTASDVQDDVAAQLNEMFQ